MSSNVSGMTWAEFAVALKAGTLGRPFLVRETPIGEPAEWYLYAASATVLMQVVTFRRERRYWRTVDGALNEMQRALKDTPLPPITIYSSVDAVTFQPGSS